MRLNLDMSLRKASSLATQRRPIEAANILTEVLERFPSNSRAWGLLADIHKMALASLSKETLLMLQALLRGGRADEVIRLSTTFQAVAFGSADLQRILGQANAALNRRHEATQHFDFATMLQPRQCAYWLAAGNDAYLAQDWNRAIRCFDKARLLEPKNLDVLNNLGMALAGANLLERADAVFAEAAAVDPSKAFPRHIETYPAARR